MDSLTLSQKKGYHNTGHAIEFLIGGLILVVLVTALSPTIFGNVNNLSNATLNPGVPTWVPTVIFVVVGAGLIFMVWKAFAGR